MAMRRRGSWLVWVAVALLGCLLLPPAAPAAAQGGTGSLDFEDGSDGAVISTSIPGIAFSNTAGNDWVYGDIRTGAYNAPYPNDCPAFGGQCAYTVGGNLFAWMGSAQGDGRIDFTRGTATFVEAAFSTADPLTVQAFAASGQRLDSAALAPNVRTGRLDVVRLSAPAGATIAYVIISGAENRWLMDNLFTDAPGLPDRPPPPNDGGSERPRAESAFVTVALGASPNVAVRREGVVTYTIVATNRGRGSAQQATIRLALNQGLRVLDAHFSRAGAWVSKLEDDAVEVQTGPLGSGGDVVTATLRLAVLASASDGADIGGRASFTWGDSNDGGQGRSNAVVLLVGASDASAPYASMQVAPASGPPGSQPTFRAAVFIPNEPVSFWYNRPDGSVVELNTLAADDDGLLVGTFDTTGLAPGSYSMVGRGNWSGISAVGAFVVGR